VTAETHLNPALLMQLSTAYWGAQTLLTANRIGLFRVLAEGPMGGDAVAAALGTCPRPTGLLLKACAGLGLLEEDERGFRNSALSQAFLVPGTETYLGEAIRYSDDLYATWGELETALRQDRPPMAAESYLGQDAVQTRHFVYGMHNRALGIGKAMTSLVDLNGRRRLLDVGGGPGTYAALFVQRYPDLQAQVLDLPEVVAIAEEIIASMGVAHQVSTLAGDYHSTPFPGDNDVVLISGVLHRESEGDCRKLLGKAFDGLQPGGLVVLSDVLTDADGSRPVFAALFGLNMLLTAPHGGVHADAAVARWVEDAGFRDIRVQPFPPPMPHRMVFGTKP